MQSPGLRRAHKSSVHCGCCEEAAVPSHLVDRALTTQHHVFLVEASRFVLMGVLWVIWHMAAAVTWHRVIFLARIGAMKSSGGRFLVRQIGRNPAEFRYFVADAATCAAVVFDDHVAPDDGGPRARTLAVRACRTCVAGLPQELFFCSPGVALLLPTRTWTCVSSIFLQQRFRVARPPLSFRPNG